MRWSSTPTKSRVVSLWGSLPAVTAGRAYEVSDDTWMPGIGVIGAGQIIDEIERVMA
ncbi:hypothetical protein [Nocardia rhizosphaerihabitans]|uniref:Fe/B12 periplasmic-binding domain-containing protein n=1 Tax=Nocardia rhizosphaerihabitans TaxID=1691570 RepID=A0ABQ2K5T8_9NOCA|nr:hypothetical protein [Nocardia rhizosphaerihabitans]GGN66900.1 hypothetical protein GCM10011610_02370 [Nocardia rhizosphaerihabitans]